MPGDMGGLEWPADSVMAAEGGWWLLSGSECMNE